MMLCYAIERIVYNKPSPEKSKINFRTTTLSLAKTLDLESSAAPPWTGVLDQPVRTMKLIANL